jgi:TetR/AcrR family transcriptional repressor of bet genes
MPKVGMEPMRRQQLIDATIEVIADVGLRGATITLISRRAGMSSGIISHYFGSKQALIEATVRYLLTGLKNELITRVTPTTTSEQRLMLIVEANFARLQQLSHTTKTWISFWARSMHDVELHRLQNVNNKRLLSNLVSSFKKLMSDDDAKLAAELTAAMIDGLWLRAVLSKSDKDQFARSEQLAKNYVTTLIKQYGA